MQAKCADGSLDLKGGEKWRQVDKFERCLQGKMTGNKLIGREGGREGGGKGGRENMNELERRRQCLRWTLGY